MAEAVALIGFGLGALAFLSTVRNAVEKLTDDFHTWAQLEQRIRDFRSRVRFVHVDLQDWQFYWYLEVEVPRSVAQAYWGTEKYEEILESANSINAVSRRLEQEFDEWCNTLVARKETKGVRKFFRRIDKTLTKVELVAGLEKILENDMKQLAEQMKILKERSDILFKRRHRIRRTLTPEDVQEVVALNCFNILHPNEAAMKALQDKLTQIQMGEEYLDVHLGCLKPEDDLVNALLNSACEAPMHCLIHLSSKTQGAGEVSAVIASGSCLLLRPRASGPEQQDLQLVDVSQMSCKITDSESVRDMIRNRAMKRLNLRARIQLQYEVVECAMFMNSVPSMCTCAIRQVKEGQRPLPAFVARKGGLMHADPCTLALGWNVNVMYRMGIALAEIALGQEVACWFDQEERALMIQVNLGGARRETRNFTSNQFIEWLAKKSQNISGNVNISHGLLGAIEYCFRKCESEEAFHPDDRARRFDFYWNVAWPLFKQYDGVYQKNKSRIW